MPTQSELIGIIKTTFEKKDYEILYPHLADSMTYQVLPSTVGKKLTKAEWREDVNRNFGVVKYFKLEPTSIIEHPLLTVVQSNATLGFPIGDFTQEVILLISFSKDESGTLQVASIVEYVDSFKVKDLLAKMASFKPHSE